MIKFCEPSATLTPGALVWAYLRDSGGPNQERSISQQAEAVQSYCQEYHLVLGEVFADQAKSGGSTKERGKFLQMVDWILNPENMPPEVQFPKGLLVWSSARFARNVAEAQTFRWKLREAGVEVHSLTDQVPEGKIGYVVETLNDIQNEEYRSRLAVETRRGVLSTMRQGYACGGFPPRGYMAELVQVGTKYNGLPRYSARWVPDPELWEVCQQAWKMRAEGSTYGEIQKATRGLIYRTDNCWQTFFRNRSYLGVGKFGADEFPDHHPAMITQEVFDRVQEVSQGSPHRGKSGHLHHPMRLAYPTLLSGFAVCGYCGSAMVSHRAENWASYVCGKKERENAAACPNRQVNAKQAEDQVLEAVIHRVLTPEYAGELLEEVKSQLNHGRSFEDEIKQIEAAQRLNDRAIKNLFDTAEMYGPEKVKDRLSKRLAEQKELEIKLRSAKAKQGAAEVDLSPEAFALALVEWRKKLEFAREKEDIRRVKQILAHFVNKVELSYNADKVKKAVIQYTYRINGDSNDENISAWGYYLSVGCRPLVVEWR